MQLSPFDSNNKHNNKIGWPRRISNRPNNVILGITIFETVNLLYHFVIFISHCVISVERFHNSIYTSLFYLPRILYKNFIERSRERHIVVGNYHILNFVCDGGYICTLTYFGKS